MGLIILTLLGLKYLPGWVKLVWLFQLFLSGQMHWASIDDRVEDVAKRMSAAQEHLRKIEENTGNSAASLKEIGADVKKMIRDGVKVR